MSRLFAGFVIVLTSACGPGSYSDFRDQLVNASCRWAQRCGYVGIADHAACPVDDVLDIFHDTSTERAAEGAIDVAASIDAGRMRYDSIHAQDCLDAVAGALCDSDHALRTRGLACNAVIGPNTETGRRCWTDGECTGGICVRLPGCAGFCSAFAPPGSPCVDTDDVPLTMRCDNSVGYCGPTSLGDEPTCQRKHPSGDACAATRECAIGWVCRTGKCTEPIELDDGAPCGGTDPCGQGSYCEPSSLVCTPVHKRNESCSSLFGCQDGLACIGLVANDPMGMPTPAITLGACGNWLDVGAACTGLDSSGRAVVSGCPRLSQTCMGGQCLSQVMTAALSEDCANKPCRAGFGCDERHRCNYLSAIFGDCSADRDKLCEPGLLCISAGSGKGSSCLPPDPLSCF